MAKAQMPFLRNYWYAAAWSDELAPGALLARRILGEDLVLFRGEGGTAVTLMDRCPHRLLPLSCGKVRGERIECGYHGLTFDSSGACVRIPGQERIPAAARVRSYPTAERHGLVWVWTGEPERADPADIFDLPRMGAAGWTFSHGPYTSFGTHYLNIADNLVDPAHTTFVHQGTLGGSAAADIPVDTTQQGDTVLVTRWIPDSAPVPMMRKYFNFAGNVDRWQYYYWYAPSISCVDFGAIEAGRTRTEEEKDGGFRIFSYAVLTPETERSTHYFWCQLRNFAVGDAQATRQLTEDFKLTFEEDRVILERIQQVQDKLGATHEIRIAIDNAAVRLRRINERLLAGEAALNANTEEMKT
jgi:phenylpropionate dioxygenase-like ring-hydroxylating dioxygenase large terminal subunit